MAGVFFNRINKRDEALNIPKQQELDMKRTIFIIVLIALVVSACGGRSTETELPILTIMTHDLFEM